MSDDDLSWFYALPMDDQVSLLRDPEQPLSPRLVDYLNDKSAATTNTHWAGTKPTPLKLTEASRLSAICEQFDDWWWDQLAVHEQDYIMQQRDGDLDGTYAEAVQAAAGDALAGVLVWNAEKDSFRLVPILRAYIEIQARSAWVSAVP
ncbi:MAG: hypothetical protein P4L48_22535 [Mycobacterium sp.]|nr:hypothetical protein [Mycobacterium sp.]